MRLVILLLVAAAALVPSAEAATRIPLKPLPVTSVGRVDGTRAFVAVSFKDGRLRVYVCDGTLKRDPTISTWFRHRWDGRKAIRLRAGGHTLALDGRMTGRLDGHAFRLRAAGSRAGLFRGHAGRTQTTWIVLPGGAKRGTFVPTRPPRCKLIAVTGSGGVQYVTVCG
jgi:hypothetical protein